MSKEEERKLAFRREIESSREFKAIQAEMSRAAQSTRKNLQQRMDNNAEFQQRKSMSKDEKAAGAVERMTDSIQTFKEQTTGKRPSREEAKKEALRIAKRALGSDV